MSWLNTPLCPPSKLQFFTTDTHRTYYALQTHIKHSDNLSINSINQSRWFSAGVSCLVLLWFEWSSADVDATGESEQAYNDVQQSDNQSSFGHEALAGAASFGAFGSRDPVMSRAC
jgi:hypothetical protein